MLKSPEWNKRIKADISYPFFILQFLEVKWGDKAKFLNTR